MDNQVSVLIADNSEEFCSALANQLERSSHLWRVVGTVQNGEAAIAAVKEIAEG